VSERERLQREAAESARAVNAKERELAAAQVGAGGAGFCDPVP
jgi:hypothetical protein